jgi:hypothetical protein
VAWTIVIALKNKAVQYEQSLEKGFGKKLWL